MLKFIAQIITILSLGTVLYIIARLLPRIDDTEFHNKKIFTRSHIIFYYIEKLDIHLKRFSEKALRYLKLILLKLENKISKKLDHIKEEKKHASRELPLQNNSNSDDSLSSS